MCKYGSRANKPTPILTLLYTTSKRLTYTKIWRTTWTRLGPTIQSTTPSLKDECQALRQDEGRMLEFGTARIYWSMSQMYSILLPNGKPKFTAKGVSRRYILKHYLHHKDYLRTLKETESTISTFSTLRSQKQQIKTIEIRNKCLSAFDDKRYLLTMK